MLKLKLLGEGPCSYMTGRSPSNWIDQILGHQLINSQDAYSLPTDEELREAYSKAYPFIKIYPEGDTGHIQIIPPKIPRSQQTVENPQWIVKKATTIEEAMNLIAEGYLHADAWGGTRIYKKIARIENKEK
jgi:hypothetical protein